MTEQAPGIYRRRVGNLVVTAINDGFLDLPLQAMQNIAPADASALLVGRFRRPVPRSSVNTYLVQGNGQTVLIDTGAGASMGPTLGRLLPNLLAAGVQPGDIDLILLTHLHGDHFGGLTSPEGEAVFKNARLTVSEADAAFWLDRAPEDGPEPARPTMRGAQAAVAPYAKSLAKGGGAPGITPVPLPGHTLGHTGYRIDDGADALLIWGDVMHVPDVQSVRPDVGVMFDIDGAQAIATRRRTLDMVAADRLAIAGMHLHFPGFAHVARRGDAYELIPETWLAEV